MQNTQPRFNYQGEGGQRAARNSIKGFMQRFAGFLYAVTAYIMSFSY